MGRQRPIRAKHRQQRRLAKRKLKLLRGLVLSRLSAWTDSVTWGKVVGRLVDVLPDPTGSRSFGLHLGDRHLTVCISGVGFIMLYARWVEEGAFVLPIMSIDDEDDDANSWTRALEHTADTIDNLLRYGVRHPSAVDLLGGISCPG